jgi:polysaccharide export outer membrane protein
VILTCFRIAIPGLLAACLAGCSTLPSQGPLADEVTRGATNSEGEARYAIVDLTDRVQAILSKYSSPTFFGRFGDHRNTPTPVIGVGDQVGVTVWEAASGGLFSAPSFGGVTAGSHSAAIPPQAVATDGTITVPYANRIRVIGLTPHQV